MSLPRRSIGRPVAVAMLFVAVSFLGLISFARLPIDLLPDVSYPKLIIYTQYAGVGPAEVERFVTTRVEEQVARVPGVQEVESISREGVSLVTVRFVWGTDMDFAVLNVRERIQTLDNVLPQGADVPVVLRTDPRSEPVMAVSIAGQTDLRALKELAESVFRRRLEQIDGVAQVAVTGGLEREIQVEVDPRKLEAYGITIAEIAEALAAANYSRPGGTVRRGRFSYSLRTLGEFETVEQIADVVVARRGGPGDGSSGDGGEGDVASTVVTLRDVAVISDSFEERESIAKYGGVDAVGLLLFKESDANTVRVSEQVDAVLADLRGEYDELSVDVAMSQAGFIADAISNVVQALILGGILALLVLFLFMRDARYPVAIALAIPISVLVTFSLLDLAGVSLNIMSLGGLALGVGMLVDNGIIVLENIFRHREMQAAGLEAGALDTAATGAEEVQGAITASTLTTISVFGPIIYVEGVAGELFGALSFAVAFSLLASLLVALTLLPVMAARWQLHADEHVSFLRRGARRVGRVAGTGLSRVFGPSLRAFDRAFARFAEWYHGVLEAALRRRGRVVGVMAAMLVVAVAIGASLERGVLPDVDQGSFRARVELPKGTPLEQTDALVTRLEEALLADPEVAAVFSQVGQQPAVAGMDERETGLHTATLEVRLAEGAVTEEVLERLRPRFRQFPPGVLSVSTSQATALGRLLGGGDADLAVRIRGDDLNAALTYAQQLEGRLARVASLENVRLGLELGQPEVQVEIDRERAAAYGIETRRIAETVERYMLGAEATQFVEFDRKIPVVVRLPESDRRSLATLDELRIDGIPLRELVRTREALGPSEIQRREQSRVVPVLADVASGGLDAAVADIRAAVAEVPTPRGLRLEIGGENEEMRKSFRDLGFAFALALLLVYMILAAQFESFIHPFTILLSVPLALVGAVVSLWVAGAGLNTMSLIGVVILVGIVVNDAIVKVDFINQARARGAAVRDAILEAGRARLRPIIMTTVTTVLGLTPMALGIGRGADLRAPLAIAVIGGLITATGLTLIVVPVAYDLIEELRGRLRGLGRPGTGEEAAAPSGSAAAPAREAVGAAGGPAYLRRDGEAPE
ncbi:MAG TPA: efflux RND transporter permease subunit [Longimicrobiales bacterium]|nr:efflux RND transporter permease subunit [Longimicrobiales bacterium]